MPPCPFSTPIAPFMPARMRLRRLSNALALGVLLGCLDDGESWRKSSCQYCGPPSISLSLVLARRSLHTRWERLLQLVGLVGVLEDKGVEALLASDLELGLRDTGALVLLYASSWNTHCQHVVLVSILCSRLSLSPRSSILCSLYFFTF